MIIILCFVEKATPVVLCSVLVLIFQHVHKQPGPLSGECGWKDKVTIYDKELKPAFCWGGLKERGGTKGLCNIHFQILKKIQLHGK